MDQALVFGSLRNEGIRINVTDSSFRDGHLIIITLKKLVNNYHCDKREVGQAGRVSKGTNQAWGFSEEFPGEVI